MKRAIQLGCDIQPWPELSWHVGLSLEKQLEPNGLQILEKQRWPVVV